jgi:hypothetical protein
LLHRHAPSFIRHVLDAFRKLRLNATEAADRLEISRSRLYALRTEYLQACARRSAHLWVPGSSGGDHTPPWPEPVVSLLQKRLGCSPPCPYSFVASEALRLHSFKLDRSQVRRWALQNGYAHESPTQRPHAPVQRWQRSQIGELWQLDASPHRWFSRSRFDLPMINMLDDCSRLFVGSKLYERELLLSYFDFLPAAFQEHGCPLQLYVDYHSIFFTHNPEALTQLGWALKFYDISFLYAPTPQAKGKIEREHQFWQKRLVPYFASEKITEVEIANRHIAELRQHRNRHETHRELRQTPQRAWDLAKSQKRSVLRARPPLPLLAVCLEPADYRKGGLRSAGADRLGTGATGTPCRLKGHSLPPSHRPSFRPGFPTTTKAKTRPPLYQSPQVKTCPVLLTTKKSCFENYATHF